MGEGYGTTGRLTCVDSARASRTTRVFARDLVYAMCTAVAGSVRLATARARVGLEVPARSVVAAAIANQTRGVARAESGPAHDRVIGWIRHLPGPAKAAHEAGPTGFGLARAPSVGLVGLASPLADANSLRHTYPAGRVGDPEPSGPSRATPRARGARDHPPDEVRDSIAGALGHRVPRTSQGKVDCDHTTPMATTT